MQISAPSSYPNNVSPYQPGAKAAAPSVELTNPNTTIAPVESLAATVAAANRAADPAQVYVPRVKGKIAESSETKKAEVEDEAAAAADGEESSGENLIADGLQDGSRQKAIEQQKQQELEQLKELSARDREVRDHEQAHAIVGGRYAGSPSYTFERGPDGRSYAVGGEVPIDVAPVSGDPQATVRKMEQVRRAALAPAEPSAQDLAVAATASQQMLQAQAELSQELAAESSSGRGKESASESSDGGTQKSAAVDIPQAGTDKKVAIAVQDESKPDPLTHFQRTGITTYRHVLGWIQEQEAAQTNPGFSAVA